MDRRSVPGAEAVAAGALVTPRASKAEPAPVENGTREGGARASRMQVCLPLAVVVFPAWTGTPRLPRRPQAWSLAASGSLPAAAAATTTGRGSEA